MLEHHKTRATMSGGLGRPPSGSLFPSPRGVGKPCRWARIARGFPPTEETGKAIVGGQELRWGVLVTILAAVIDTNIFPDFDHIL